MPAVQTCGVDIDDENQGKSWNEGFKNCRDSTTSKDGRGRWNAGGGQRGMQGGGAKGGEMNVDWG